MNEYTQMDSDLSEMTIPELKQLRANWINEANTAGDIEACTKVGRELGKICTYRQSRHLNRWQDGEVVVEYFEHEGNYMPASGRYSKDVVVKVSLGLLKGKNDLAMGDHNRRVLYFAHGDNLTDIAKNNIFIPGDWLNSVHAALPNAEKLIRQREKDIGNAEHRELVALLTAGQ